MISDRNKWVKLSALISLLCIISFIPVVALMIYAHPFADEYIESLYVHRAVQSGAGIISVLHGAWTNMIISYKTWQGTFTAKFIMAMNPLALFGDELYFTGILSVFLITLLEHFFFLNILLKKVLSMKTYEWIIVSCLTFFVSVHFMPDPTQGLYWFESSSYYIGIYGLGLFSLGCCLLAITSDKKAFKSIMIAVSSVTAFLAGGGSMQSGLLLIFAFLAITIMSFLVKSKDAPRTLIPLLFMIIGFLVSVLAPGNAVRGHGSYSEIGALMTIYKSVHEACVLLDQWNTLYSIALYGGVIVPLCMAASRRIHFSFPLPLFVTIYLCGMFACQFTPAYYAYDMLGPLRAVNPIYFSYQLLLVTGIFYWCGWIKHKFASEENDNAETKLKSTQWYFREGIMLIVLIFGIGCISSDRLSYLTGVSALQSLVSGEAQEYDEQRTSRSQILEENMNNEVSVNIPELTAKPYLLYFEDGELNEDPKKWINVGISNYYGLKDVRLVKN